MYTHIYTHALDYNTHQVSKKALDNVLVDTLKVGPANMKEVGHTGSLHYMHGPQDILQAMRVDASDAVDSAEGIVNTSHSVHN